MAEFLLELFSEEIPARMQRAAAETMARMLNTDLARLQARLEGEYTPRRIAVHGDVAARVAAETTTERGPRLTAPDAALAGFLRKHAAARDDLVAEDGYWWLRRTAAEIDAGGFIAGVMPGVLRRFPWPKAMRWGAGSQFTWVRPLRRILCLLDGAVVDFDLRAGTDDGHGLVSGNLTEGHRFLSPGAFAVRSVAEWRAGLRARHVVIDPIERRRMIWDGVTRRATAQGLQVVADEALLDEVTSLVEWPVPMLGRIDEAFMDLPPEVMQVSMRENQRYFALRDAHGRAAPYFAFIANIDAPDGGAAIVAGNERVLRARFADARHFWDLDRKLPLAERVAALDKVVFHARLGTQYARAERLRELATTLAPPMQADTSLAAEAAFLCKADLTTGMVGEFPELQGIMGGYYAEHDGLPPGIWQAIRDHYLPEGPTDGLPSEREGDVVAIADKLDQLMQFFAIGEKPTGSGDPYALRRAALGVIRIVREKDRRLNLSPVLAAFAPNVASEVLAFITDRLKGQLRTEGHRHDVIEAALSGYSSDDMRVLALKVEALSAFLGTEDGDNLLAAYRRGTNILRIEEKRDARQFAASLADPSLRQAQERDLARALAQAEQAVTKRLDHADFSGACAALAELRAPVDDFFTLTINDSDPATRETRLSLLARTRETMNRVADFSKIEG